MLLSEDDVAVVVGVLLVKDDVAVAVGGAVVRSGSPSLLSGTGKWEGSLLPLSVGVGGASPALSGADGDESLLLGSGSGRMEGTSSASSAGGKLTGSGTLGSGATAGNIPNGGLPKGLS